MRDPDAELRLTDTHAVRFLHRPLAPGHFLRTSTAERLVERGQLVPYSIADELTLSAPRLPFVSRPDEWCDAQLHACARLTLTLQSEAVAAGFELKDASAWNLIHRGTQPVFCDLLSFVPMRSRRWWAAGQFARHFIVPLWLSRTRGLNAHRAFACWRDGVPAADARRLIGAKRYLSRYWPLLAEAQTPPSDAASEASQGESPEALRYRERLQASLEWMVNSLAPRAAASNLSLWSRYVDERNHYGDEDVRAKRTFVAQALSETRPSWVLDLGCNTGEFSMLAIEAGADVVAIDGDHDCIERLTLNHPGPHLHPVVAALDDLPGARGWGEVEHAGLAARLEQRFDSVLMLGLVHHLAIGASLPLRSIAEWVRRCTRRDAIVEFIDGSDVRAAALARQRRRDPLEFPLVRQQEAFAAAGFEVVSQVDLPGVPRQLAWLRRSA
jgi:SAM-dependent methyltransferase